MRLFILLLVFVFTTNLFAKVVTVESEGSSIIEKGMTKQDARSIALIYAKQNAVEQVGTVVRSVFTKSVRSSGKKQASYELKTFSSALIKTKILSVKYTKQECKVKIKASLDTKEVEKHIIVDDDFRQQLKMLMLRQEYLLKEFNSLKSSKEQPNKVVFSKNDIRRMIKNYSELEKVQYKTIKSFKSLVRSGKFYDMKLKAYIDTLELMLREFKSINEYRAEIKTIVRNRIYVKVSSKHKISMGKIVDKYKQILNEAGFILRRNGLGEGFDQKVSAKDEIMNNILKDNKYGLHARLFIKIALFDAKNNEVHPCKDDMDIFYIYDHSDDLDMRYRKKDAKIFSCKIKDNFRHSARSDMLLNAKVVIRKKREWGF